MSKKVYAITGGTGLLGRNFIFEIIKKNIKHLSKIKILFFGRESEFLPLKERIRNLIQNDGIHYIGVAFNDYDLIDEIIACFIPIGYDLTKENLGLTLGKIELLKSEQIDYFLHIAALTDFRDNHDVRIKLEEINVVGTIRVLNLISILNVKQAIYISSAYVSRATKGSVPPSNIDLAQKFRNPYEESKLKAEIVFRSICKAKKIKHKIFRPSTISGRLYEAYIGSTPKFDVFYAWAAFFLRIKQKQIREPSEVYNIPLELPVRIQVNKKSGLNIIPADYAAKIIYETIESDHKDSDFHLAHHKDFAHEDYIKLIFESLNIQGYELVEIEPADKNELERFYYKTVGKLFTPYIVEEPLVLDTSNLKEVHNKINYNNVNIGRDEFLSLMNYAQKRHFHVDKKSV